MRILKQPPQRPTTLGALIIALLKCASNLRTRAALQIIFPIILIFTFATLLIAQEGPAAIEITDPQVPRNAVLLAQGTVDITFKLNIANVKRVRIRVVTPLDAATRDISIDPSQTLHSVSINLFKGTNRITLFGFNGDAPDPAISKAIDVTCNGRRCGAADMLIRDVAEQENSDRNALVNTFTAANNKSFPPALEPGSENSKPTLGTLIDHPSSVDSNNLALATPLTARKASKTSSSTPSATTEAIPAFPPCNSDQMPSVVTGHVTVKAETGESRKASEPIMAPSDLAQADIEVTDGVDHHTVTSNASGNYNFSVCKAGEYTISVTKNGYITKEPFVVSSSDIEKHVNVELLVRPLGEYSRAIVGFEQAGASAAKGTQKYFFDLTLSTPVFGKSDPLFGRRGRAWGSVRLTSVPQQITSPVTTFATGFAQQVANVKVNEVAQAIQFLAGGELRIHKWNENLIFGSFDGSTSNRFTLSLIAGGGMTTPVNPRETLDVFKVSPGAPGLPTIPAGKDFIAFVSPDRDRFFRQYYAGLRLQTYYFDYRNPSIPLQRFPATLDITFGQNEAVTGGRLRGGVLRLLGFYPLPYSGLKFINIFGTALMKLSRTKITDPLILEPAPAGTTVPAANVFLLTVPQINRDYYRVGVGIDFISLIKKWTETPTPK